jgi:hypothetical protein
MGAEAVLLGPGVSGWVQTNICRYYEAAGQVPRFARNDSSCYGEPSSPARCFTANPATPSPEAMQVVLY